MKTLPPLTLALSFVDRINHGDSLGLAQLMSDDHRLEVFNEPPLIGRAENQKAWAGYFSDYPDYLIHPSRMAESGEAAAILGTTTGSHLGLPDSEERKLSLIWVARVRAGLVRAWQLVEDSAENRQLFGLAE